jgi:hypothetical protein
VNASATHAVFGDAAGEIARDADIERGVGKFVMMYTQLSAMR